MKSESQRRLQVEFERIFDTHGCSLRRLCSAYRRDAAEQQDLLQEIAVALWTALPNFRGQSSERTWVYRIAHNVALTYSAKRRRLNWFEQPLDPRTDAPAAQDDPQRLALLEAVQQLKSVDRQLVLLYLEGLSGKEISEVTGLSTDNVGVRLNRLRHKLGITLGRKG